MDDLISRRAAIEAIEKNAYRHTYLDQIISIIERMPTADSSEYCDKLWKIAYERGKEEARPKGNWIPIKNTRLVECECGFITDRLCEYNFCPNCGEKMEN